MATCLSGLVEPIGGAGGLLEPIERVNGEDEEEEDWESVLSG